MAALNKSGESIANGALGHAEVVRERGLRHPGPAVVLYVVKVLGEADCHARRGRWLVMIESDLAEPNELIVGDAGRLTSVGRLTISFCVHGSAPCAVGGESWLWRPARFSESLVAPSKRRGFFFGLLIFRFASLRCPSPVSEGHLESCVAPSPAVRLEFIASFSYASACTPHQPFAGAPAAAVPAVTSRGSHVILAERPVNSGVSMACQFLRMFLHRSRQTCLNLQGPKSQKPVFHRVLRDSPIMRHDPRTGLSFPAIFRATSRLRSQIAASRRQSAFPQPQIKVAAIAQCRHAGASLDCGSNTKPRISTAFGRCVMSGRGARWTK
jgi:hypothetical protein